MFKVMGRKNKAELNPELLPDGLAGKNLSGADIESVVLTAKRSALIRGHENIMADDLKQAIEEFIPSAQGLEKEKQELAAVLECTSMSFLPENWKERLAHPNERAKLQERMAEIRKLIDD
jgi:hypothetical protein